MKNRSKIPKSTEDELLVESRHRCNVCKRDVAQIHHIDRIDSRKGNEKSNLIVLCTECHRRAHLPPSYFERRLTQNQLKMYKKQWADFCRNFPDIYVEKPILAYTFLNKPRIESLFNQLATNSEIEKVDTLRRHQNELIVPTIPLERMMEIIRNKIDFINVETLGVRNTLDHLEELEGLAVYIGKDFYGHGLKSPTYYAKHGVKEFPYLFQKLKVVGSKLLIKIPFNPKHITSDTGYVELAGHHRLSCYGIVKRILKSNNNGTVEIMPLAIGLKQPIWAYNAYFRFF